MWVFWVTGAVMVFVILINVKKAADDPPEIAAFTLIAGFATLVVTGIAYSIHHEITTTDPVYTVSYPLHEIKMGSEQDSTGWFLVIAGGYDKDEELKYYFYVEHPTNGTLQLQKEDADDVIFKQGPTNKPRITCKTNYEDNRDQSYEDAYNYDCVFHVPEGSISNDIDLEIPK